MECAGSAWFPGSAGRPSTRAAARAGVQIADLADAYAMPAAFGPA
jgi:hypothetical protein